MHFLEAELERNEKLNSTLHDIRERTQENRAKLGILLDLNPFWLLDFRAQEAGLSDDWPRDPMPFSRFSEFLRPLFGSQSLPDLTFRSDWSSYMTFEYFGKKPRGNGPFLFKIASRADSGVDPDLLEDHEILRGVAAEQRVLTIVEAHPQSTLANAPGASLLCGRRTGTLGGYVRDQHGSDYAMTCGHVTRSSSVCDGSGTSLGRASHVVEPVSLPSGTICTDSCGHMTDLDVALIDSPSPGRNIANSVAQLIGNGQIVEMVGAVTPSASYEIGAHVVEYEIGGACWSRLVQIHTKLSGILPTSVRLALSPPPRRGDSGSWLVKNNSEWAAMVVARNPIFGFAMSATKTISECNNRFGLQLSLTP